MKMYYPAKLKVEDGAYLIDMVDLKGCSTFGNSLEEVIEYAKEAIGLYLDDYEEKDYPKATLPEKIKMEKGELLVLIEFDNIEYLKKLNMD